MQGVGASPDGKPAPGGPRGGVGVVEGGFLFLSWLAGFLGGDTKSGMVAGAALLLFQLHHLELGELLSVSSFFP